MSFLVKYWKYLLSGTIVLVVLLLAFAYHNNAVMQAKLETEMLISAQYDKEISEATARYQEQLLEFKDKFAGLQNEYQEVNAQNQKLREEFAKTIIESNLEYDDREASDLLKNTIERLKAEKIQQGNENEN